MHSFCVFLAAVVPIVLASPTYTGPPPRQYCKDVQWLDNALHITISTTTTTVTSTPAEVTTTATTTVTTTTTPTTTTTIQPVTTVTVPPTAYCEPAGTVVKREIEVLEPRSHNQQRAPIPQPECLHGRSAAKVSKACSCLSLEVPRPVTTTATKTEAAQTTTTTVTTTTEVTAATPITVTSSATSTSTVTKTDGPTTTIPSGSSGTYTASDSSTHFIEYTDNMDFIEGSLAYCLCDSTHSTCNFGAYGTYQCTSFTDCQDICATINTNLGVAACLGVTYTGAISAGIPSCYPKRLLSGCGQYQPFAIDSAILDFSGYKYSHP